MMLCDFVTLFVFKSRFDISYDEEILLTTSDIF